MYLQILGNLRCTASDRSPTRAQHAVCILSMESTFLFDHLRSHTLFSKENSCMNFYCQKKGCSHETILLHFLKARSHRWCKRWCCVGAAHGLCCDSEVTLQPRAMCSTTAWRPGSMGMIAEHRPAPTQVDSCLDQLFYELQCSSGQDRLRGALVTSHTKGSKGRVGNSVLFFVTRT